MGTIKGPNGEKLFVCPCCWGIKLPTGYAECVKCHEAGCVYNYGNWKRAKQCPGVTRMSKARRGKNK